MKKKYAIAAAAAVILAGSVFFAGNTYARYMQTSVQEGTAQAAEFYFNSDLLNGSNHVLAPQTTSITFTLENAADKLRISQVDIEYSIETDGGTLSKTSGILKADAAEAQTITLSNLEAGKTYTVSATGENGYEKTLTATFTVLNEESAVTKKVENKAGYVELTVTAQNFTGDIDITFPESLNADNTDALMQYVFSNTFTDSTSFQNGGKTSYVYRFFPENADDALTYTESDFSVLYNGVQAQIAS